MITRLEACSPRRLGRAPERSKQCEQACWQALGEKNSCIDPGTELAALRGMQRFRHPDQFGKRLKVGHRVRFGSQSGQQVFRSSGPGSLFTIRTSRTHFLATTHVGARLAAGRMLDRSVTPSASAISGLVSPPTRSDSKAQGLRTSSKVGLNRVRPISATRRSLGPYFSEPLNFAQKVRIPKRLRLK